MIEHIVLAIALVILGAMWIVITLKPAMTVKLILRFFLPGYHVIKDRKKVMRKVRKGEVVFP